jgi:anaerobic ribonucleoside-triphosphate reductase activating protein
MSAADASALRIFRRSAPVHVLGPGARAAIWVQGCPFKCPGCIVPDSWDSTGGELVSVAELAAWVLAQPRLDGITLSGGEPMAQAAALACLVGLVRGGLPGLPGRDLSVLCYTGYRLGDLQHRGTAEQRELLALCDLLIDGPYIQAQHADLLWRGSRNQRIHALTPRHSELVAALGSVTLPDSGAGLELDFDGGGLGITGVPALPGFRAEFEARLAARGVRWSGMEAVQ